MSSDASLLAPVALTRQWRRQAGQASLPPAGTALLFDLGALLARSVAQVDSCLIIFNMNWARPVLSLTGDWSDFVASGRVRLALHSLGVGLTSPLGGYQPSRGPE